MSSVDPELESIVRDLAAQGAPLDRRPGGWVCRWRGADADGTAQSPPHDPECLWRRAGAWVAAHPEGDTK